MIPTMSVESFKYCKISNRDRPSKCNQKSLLQPFVTKWMHKQSETLKNIKAKPCKHKYNFKASIMTNLGTDTCTT